MSDQDKQVAVQTNSLIQTINTAYKNKIQNFFAGDSARASIFMTGIIEDVRRNPKLLECDQSTLLTSYMMMAQLQLMPSGVSGEAYVLPYNDKHRGMIAQFQLGYQGLVTLFYRAGIKRIHSDIVREGDSFSYVNGNVSHEPDVFGNRGVPKGAYVIIKLPSGEEISKVMSKEEIMNIGKKFSKSFSTDVTPWKEANDPELWMWKKTVLKQLAKMIPKNENINAAIAEDNKESIISDRMEKAKEESVDMTMGAHLISEPTQNNENQEAQNEAQPA